jgi:hypothetical protein
MSGEPVSPALSCMNDIEIDRELARIDALTAAELRQEIIDGGEDPDEVTEQTRAILLAALAEWEASQLKPGT